MRRLCAWLAIPAFLVALVALVPRPFAPTIQAQENRPDGVLAIPRVQSEIDLDGSCDEYADAAVQTFADANASGRVYLQHDFNQLYVCIEAQPGTFAERFMSVYLDPQGDGSSYTFARQDDYSLRVGIAGNNTTSLRGSGVANGYIADASIDPFWSAVADVSANGETAEYSITPGRFFINDCRIFGIAAYHHWVSAVGDDYGWPSNQFFDQPRSWQLATLDSPVCTDPQVGTIAYVFRGDTPAATSFYNLLTANGYLVDLIPLASVLATDFNNYDLTIIADDSGYLSQWGLAGQTANQVAKITAPNKPVLGLGEGGYAFFGRLALFIGWPNGWHGPKADVIRAAPAPAAYFNGIGPDPVNVYNQPVNEVGIYLDDDESLPPDVVPIGLEPPSPDHAALIIENCRHLWGFSGNPLEMTGEGEDLFLNAVEYARTFQCPPTEAPPEPCVSVEKIANPPAGTPVAPGDVIEYTINYVFSDDPQCENPESGRLIDFIPPDTIYVPGSASDGIDPTADGALVWPVTPAAGTQTKTFRVRVSDTQCVNQQRVNNQARLISGVAPPVQSNLVSHPVECPPIRFPNDEPPYAEDEVQITPYPMITGQPSNISVKLSNASNQPQTVTVSFQVSPNRFGIGLNFNQFASKVVTIPPNGNAIVDTDFTPISSGHYCIQIVVTGEDGRRVVTQRNLDVTEDLTPGEADELEFPVGNPTANNADVRLVVDNTCPGWTATVSPELLPNMAPGEIRTATLRVTPPASATLGTACHIDVQGWIDDDLIGGIRKLDVPPVHLPPDVDPPWMEPEISFIPDPPVAGQPARICVELQNPLAVSRQVSIDYAVADFGAGIFFTSVGTQSFTLPPNSIDDYCINWTPDADGTLHRCVLVTLSQANYADQTSQRNVNLVEPDIIDLSELDLPILVRNPDLVPHNLQLVPTVYGIDPFWQVQIVDPQGNPPPEVLGAGERVELRLRFAANPSRLTQNPPDNFRFGDQSRVEVAVQLDGETIGGFTADLGPAPEMVYLPLVYTPR